MTDDVIDHLWIRVSDVAAAKAFYAALAPHTGLELAHEEPGRVHFANRGSFGLVEDERPVTEELHMAFPGADQEAVHAFHRDALAATTVGPASGLNTTRATTARSCSTPPDPPRVHALVAAPRGEQ